MNGPAETKAYLLGIDVGTSSLKVCALDEDGHQAATAQRPYRIFAPHPGWMQIDFEDLWNAVLACLQELKGGRGIDLRRVRGLGLSTLCPAISAVSADGEVLAGPIPYNDRRSTAQAEEILRKAGREKLFEVTANGSMAGSFSGSSLLWMCENEPKAYEKARWFVHLNSLLALRMTGVCAADPTNASYSNLYDTAGQSGWSEELCDLLEVDRAKLPPVISSSESCGGLLCEDLIRLGIPRGTPVVIGAGDTPCAAFAAGVLKAGDACESAGTTDVLTVCVDRPLFDGRFINRCYVAPGTWIYQGSVSFAGASNAWFANEFYGAESGTLERANREASGAKPGCGGVVFLPYMRGERSPVWDPNARGVFYGLSLDTTRADMSRAVLESTGYGLRQFLEIAEGLTGRRIDRLISIGGGAKSEVWAQIKADITGREIAIPDADNFAAAGAALLAGVSCGMFDGLKEAAGRTAAAPSRVFTPDGSCEETYRQRYETYRRLYPALRNLFASNAAQL